MSFSFGPTGITGGDGRTQKLGEFTLVWSQNSYPITTSAQTVWAQRTSVSGIDGGLDAGPYLLWISISGSSWYSENYTGIMYWYPHETNDGDANTITLHNSGHAQNGRQFYCRTRRVGRNTNTDLQFQIWSAGSYAPNISIYVKRLG